MIAVCHSTNSLKLHRKNKECAKHILAPVAVASDIFIIRRSAHPAGGFYYIGNEISYVMKNIPVNDEDIFNRVCNNLLKIIKLSILGNDLPESHL